ncbi:ParB N-terminal domain-containing protein [Paenibacillus elgii]|uniref:ParB N-terminal domain-containing protein n=1 Tax=Paenibacillus elgii TaxID=189691 RepID=UPI002D7DE62D|nr:ParB N-terminal domain-containing protein [Paenibacillus elgii]
MMEQAVKSQDKYTEVFITKDYDRFNTIDGNRIINELHVKRLIESMQQKQLITPIIVNEKHEIIDGQHRFKAQSSLGLPVYYIVCEGYGLSEVHRLNEKSNNWKANDFLNGYATYAEKEEKFFDYVLLKDFIESNVITPILGIFLTKGELNEQDAMTAFKNGHYKAKNIEAAQLFMDQLEDFSPYFHETYKSTKFIKAYLLFSGSTKYNHDNMIKKLEYMSGYLQPRNQISQYLDILSDIYNTRLSEKSRIHFKGEKEL